jgi:hypothetical protein
MEALGDAVELLCMRGEDDVRACTVNVYSLVGGWDAGVLVGIESLVD